MWRATPRRYAAFTWTVRRERRVSQVGTAAGERQEDGMPRYLIERTFPDGLYPPDVEEGADVWGAIVANNSDDLVTWIHSYVTEDKSKSFCIYEAPSPEAVRRAARRNNLPVDKIYEVHLLDPYSYR
jgi:uncharacterized protein DUF4242